MAVVLSGYLALGSGFGNGALSELASYGYARQSVSFATSGASTLARNQAAVTFGPATGSWATATYCAVFDSASGGNLLAYWGRVPPNVVTTSNTLGFATNAINLIFASGFFNNSAITVSTPICTVSDPLLTSEQTGYAGVALQIVNNQITASTSGGGSTSLTASGITALAVVSTAGFSVSGSPATQSNAQISLGLLNSGATAGTYFSPTIVVDSLGRITTATQGSFTAVGANGISISASPVTNGTLTMGLSATGVSQGTYNNPVLTVDSYGRISFVQTTTSSGVQRVQVINGTGILITNGTLTGTAGTVTVALIATGVTGATYVAPTVQVDSTGRVTQISAPSYGYAQLDATGKVARQYLTALTVSSSGTILTSTSGQIVDSDYNVWQLVPGSYTGTSSYAISRNSVVDPTTGNVDEAEYSDDLFWQHNTYGNWYYWVQSSGAWVNNNSGPGTNLSITQSASGTVLDSTSGSITDSYGNVWQLVAGSQTGTSNFAVERSGIVDASTGNVDEVEYSGGVFWQHNTYGNWYYWVQSSSSWINNNGGPGTDIGAGTGSTSTSTISVGSGTYTITGTGVNSVRSVAPVGAATGASPMRGADLMNAFGANTFCYGQGGGDWSVATVAAAINWITGDSGYRMMLREYISDGSIATQSTWCPAINGATGAVFSLCLAVGNPPTNDLTGLATNGAGKWLFCVEGNNEPNNYFGDAQPNTLTPSQVLTAQQAIYNVMHPLGVPVAGPSIVGDGDTFAQYLGGSLNSCINASDWYNSHLYPNNGSSNQNQWGGEQLQRWSQFISQNWGNKPGIMSEFHPTLYNLGSVMDDAHAAYYTPMALLCGVAFYGLRGIFWFEFYSYTGYPINIGLFDSNASNPHPATVVMKAMYALMADTGSNPSTFTPTALPYTITNLPTGTTTHLGGQSAMFQCSDGSYRLAVWNEQTSLNTGVSVPVTVSFNGTSLTSIVDYSLTNPVSTNPTAKQSLSHASSIVVNLTTEVRILVIHR